MNNESGKLRGGLTTFTSLKNPHYRWFWLGMFISFTAINLQLVARNWLVYGMSDSQRDVGWVAFAYGLPILFLSLYGGALAERVKKRTLLIWTLFGNGLISLVIAILITTDNILLWHLIVAGALSGVLFAFHVPARFAIVPDLVQERDYLNAVALNAMGWNLSVLLSSVGALLLPIIEVEGVFWITVAAFFVSIPLLFMLPSVDSGRRVVGTSIWKELAGGLVYIHRNTVVRSLLAVAFICILFGLPYMNLMPDFAKKVFDVGEIGYGFLLSAPALGALVVSLIVASLHNLKKKGFAVLTLAFLFGVSLVLFAMSGNYYLSLVFLVAVGGFSAGYFALHNTLLQMVVPYAVLGRVMGVYVIMLSFVSLGTLPLSYIADARDAALSIGIGGAVIALCAVAVVTMVPRVRRTH
ncbi:MAG: MFS transporter [Dehalococcoidia bacterium]|jgi:MFS family permease